MWELLNVINLLRLIVITLLNGLQGKYNRISWMWFKLNHLCQNKVITVTELQVIIIGISINDYIKWVIILIHVITLNNKLPQEVWLGILWGNLWDACTAPDPQIGLLRVDFLSCSWQPELWSCFRNHPGERWCSSCRRGCTTPCTSSWTCPGAGRPARSPRGGRPRSGRGRSSAWPSEARDRRQPS